MISPFECRKILVFISVAGCLLFGRGVRGDWVVKEVVREDEQNRLVEQWRAEVQDSDGKASATLHFALFHPSTVTLNVIDQPSKPRRSLAQVCSDTGALAGVNGGYFDKQDKPLGLRVINGKVTNPLGHGRLMGGVLIASARKVDIVRPGRFSPSSEVKAALQCGPMLVEAGQEVKGLNQSQEARRTFAVITNNKSAVIGVCSSVSLADLPNECKWSQSENCACAKPGRRLFQRLLDRRRIRKVCAS